MKIQQIVYSKELKLSKNFNSIMAGMHVTVEYDKNEKPNHEAVWDMINQQLQIETQSCDPSWIKKEELKIKK